MTDINKTLDERKQTHGDFLVQAKIAQRLKTVVNEVPLTSSTKREAIEMILHKIARIHSGDSSHADHWHDIAGYASLVVRELERESNATKLVKKPI